MASRARTKIALVGGAFMVALAAGVGDGVLLGDTTTPTTVADPTSSVTPTPHPQRLPERPVRPLGLLSLDSCGSAGRARLPADDDVHDERRPSPPHRS